MALSFDANIQVGSAIGFNVVGGILLGVSPVPKVETTRSLNSTTSIPSVGWTGESKLLAVSSLEPFRFAPNKRSAKQTVYMTNFGSAALTVTEIIYTFKGDVRPTFYFDPENTLYNTITNTASSITILPNNTATFEVSYTGGTVGDYANFFVILSNNSLGAYKVETLQEVRNTYQIIVDPVAIATTSTYPGNQELHTYVVTPIIDQDAEYGRSIDLSASIESADSGWTIESAGFNTETNNNEVVAKLSTIALPQDSGTYTSTASIIITSNFNGLTSIYTATSTVVMDIDYNNFQNLGYWVSPAASNNSIVGISYDIINSKRVVTIGVGLGSDDTPLYQLGGSIFTTNNGLGIYATATDVDYPAWATVYRIELDGSASEYFTGDEDISGLPMYLVKSTGIDYASHFGMENSRGSMFCVRDDGDGNVRILANHLREQSSDPVINTTLKNLTRSFYYYVSPSVETRYTQLSSAPTLDGTVTELFIGFSNRGSVKTSLVPLAVSF
jgi:hypothetical protein